MTDAPTLTGRDIGLAENATRAILDSLLAANATTFDNGLSSTSRPATASPALANLLAN